MPDDALGGLFAGLGSVAGSVVDGIFGYYGQKREFAQQEKMTDKQNEWNSAQAQMQRAKEAGINPLTAAGAIAGSAGATGVAAPAGSAPATNFQEAGKDLAALPAEIAAKRAGAKRDEAAANKDNVEADNIPRRVDSEILVNASAAAKNLTSAGIPEIQAMELGLSLARNGLNGFANAFNADGMCRKFDLELNKIDAEINVENQRFADLQAQTRLHGSLAELTEQQRQHEEVLTAIDKRKKALGDKYEAFFMQNDTMAQFSLVNQFGYDSAEYRALMKFYQDKFYNQSKGSYEADVETAFDRFKNQVQGSDVGKRVNAKYFAKLDNYKFLFGEIARMYFSSDGDVQSLAGRFVSILSAELSIGSDELERMIKESFNPSEGE